MSGRCHARLVERQRSRRSLPRCALEVDTSAVEMFDRLAVPEHRHRLTIEIASHIGMNQHNRTSAVGDDTAIEPVQRITHHRGVEDLFHRHRVREEGIRDCAGRAMTPQP